jgi:hypothetical protein
MEYDHNAQVRAFIKHYGSVCAHESADHAKLQICPRRDHPRSRQQWPNAGMRSQRGWSIKPPVSHRNKSFRPC